MNGFNSLIFEKLSRVAWITLNRPHVHNAINLEMRDELWVALDAVELDPEISVGVFQGAGAAAFCSGADLNDFGSAESLLDSRRGRRERDLWGRLAEVDKPLVAAVGGYALGAGLELALLCDICLASETATFGLPEASLGYLPSAGGTQTLPRLVGQGRGLEMILSGRRLEAKAALAYGIVSKIVDAAQLQAAAGAVANAIAALEPGVVRATRRAVRVGADLPLAEGLVLEARLGRRVKIENLE